MHAPRRNGFTLVEVLTVVGVIALLVGLLLPAMRNVKESSGEATCGSNLRQIGAATMAYLGTYKDHLPQAAALNPMTSQNEVIGSLFGGKRGQLQMFGIDEIGADKRPLNKFLASGSYLVDTDPTDGIDEDVPLFNCPLDRGQPAQPPFLPQVDSMYDFVGTSYTLNDHSLDSENCATLVPKRTGYDPGDPTHPGRPGGKMPAVADPTKVWMIADLPIYNYQEMGDRQQKWHFGKCRCNLCFVDGHVGQGIEIPPSTMGPDGRIVENTTKWYTFYPHPKWDCDPYDGVP